MLFIEFFIIKSYYYTLRSQSLFRELQITLYTLSCVERGHTARTERSTAERKQWLDLLAVSSGN